jgi:hypothetical protein
VHGIILPCTQIKYWSNTIKYAAPLDAVTCPCQAARPSVSWCHGRRGYSARLVAAAQHPEPQLSCSIPTLLQPRLRPLAPAQPAPGAVACGPSM